MIEHLLTTCCDPTHFEPQMKLMVGQLVVIRVRLISSIGDVLRIEKSNDVIITDDPDAEDVRETEVYSTNSWLTNGKKKSKKNERLLSVEFVRK